MLGAGIRPRSDSTSQSGEQTPINSQRQRANRRRIRRLPVACSVGASWLSSTDQQQAKRHQEGQTKPPVFPCAFGRTQKHAPTVSECLPTGACTQANTRRAPLGDPNVFALPPFSPLNTNLPCPAHFETSVASEASDTLSHQTLWSRAKRATPLLLLSTGIAFLVIKFHCCCCFVSLFYYYFIIILATCCCCCSAGATVTGISLIY